MRGAQRIVGGIAAALALGAPVIVAVPAEATVYCVNESACPAGGVSEGSNGAALQKALDDAQTHVNSGGPDEVLVGAGTYSRAGEFFESTGA